MPIEAQSSPSADPKALVKSLRDPCRVAKGLELDVGAKAKAFFEEHFLPLRISRLGEGEGFVTGYYEPIVDGSDGERSLQGAVLLPDLQCLRSLLHLSFTLLAQLTPDVPQNRPP